MILDLDPSLRVHAPDRFHPMYPKLECEPFNRAGWLFEPKLDGDRAIAQVLNGKVNLYSRKLKDYNSWFRAVPEILEDDLKSLGHDVVLDGEVVMFIEDKGKKAVNFHTLLHKRLNAGILAYCVFDVVWINGFNLMSEPLRKRKDILSQILKPGQRIQSVPYQEEKGVQFFIQAALDGHEGIVAKNADSQYIPAKNEFETNPNWVKVKYYNRPGQFGPNRIIKRDWAKIVAQTNLQ